MSAPQPAPDVPPAPDAAPNPARTQFRWVVCALLFFATTINYIDRQVIGVLKSTLSGEFGWSEVDYANIVFAFQAAYALGLLVVGRLVDRIGVRAGFALAIAFWSLAAIAHAPAGLAAGYLSAHAPGLTAWLAALAIPATVFTFGLARFLLGLGEAANFPAAIKAVADWFPKRERALATGIFNAGSNVGALVTPIAVPWIVLHWGWYEAFVITGALGFVWLAFWLVLYRRPEVHPRVNAAELAHIRSDPVEPTTHLRWLDLIPHRQTWGFAIAKFMTDPIWWFYLFWIPGFLQDKHGLDLKSLGPPLVVIYLMTDVGSVAGGWLSSRLIHRGWSVNAARKTALLVCALCVVPIIFVSQVSNLWVATLLIGLAASAHQGWSANLFTVVSDTMPRRAVSSVVGLGGMFGAVGGMGIAKLAGYILETTHGNYFVLFVIAGSAYLVALLILHLLIPRLEPAKFA